MTSSRPPALSGVVTAAGGLRVAQRGAGAGDDCDLRVVDVRPVTRPDSPHSEAVFPDGALWRRMWMLPERLVLEFVGQVVVEVCDGDGAIVFDRVLPPDLEQHLLLDHVLPLVLARRGDIVLHAGVLTRDDRAVMVIGQSGAGKSTLTAFAGQRGWTIGGDDCAVVRPAPAVTAEPTYPTVRLTQDAARLLGMSPDVGSAIAGKRRLSDDGQRFRQQPAALALIARIEPVPEGEPATFTTLRGAEAHTALLTSTIHADVTGGAMFQDVLTGLIRVVESVRVGRLSVPRGRAGLADAERVLRESLAS